MILARIFFAILIIITSQTTISTANDSLALTKEAKDTFSWFDKLEFPDVTGKRFVLVATGEWWAQGDGPKNNSYVYGYLLAEDDKSFTIFASDLRIRTFHRSFPPTPEYERVNYKIADLEKTAQLYLKSLQNSNNNQELWFHAGYLNERAELFVMAWACWKNNFITLSQSLFELAKKIEPPDDEHEKHMNTRQLLEQDLGYEMIWLTVMDAGNPAISRPELLKRFEAIAKHFPESTYAKQARSLAKILGIMVREDTNHLTKPLEKLPIEDQVSELIYQLRDQHGYQISQPGSCDIFRDQRGENSPAHRLVKIGLPAVPQLIKVLNDDRLTRSIDFNRGSFYSHYILRVGDAAIIILEVIAHQRFEDAGTKPRFLAQPNLIPKICAKVSNWWKSIQSKGEKNFLLESVANGQSSIEQAQLLISKYPDSALQAIVRGIQNTKEEKQRTSLVEELSGISGNEPVPFLLQEMNNSPFLDAKVAAANGLLRHNRLEAVPAMIQDWKMRSKSDGFALTELLKFLVWCNDSEAIRAISTGLNNRRSDVRSDVIDVFNEGSFLNSFDIFKEQNFRKRFDALSETVQKEIETLLVAELEDTAEEPSFLKNDLRICDSAAAVLANLWPEKYKFDGTLSVKAREKQRIECINVWKKAHGLQEIAFPASKPAKDHQNQVVEVLFPNEKPSVIIAQTVEAMKGKILTSDDFINLFIDLITSEPEKIGQIRLHALREEDLAGIILKIEFFRNEPQTKDTKKQKWHFTEKVILRKDSLRESEYEGFLSKFTTVEEYRYFIKDMDKAMAGNINASVSISLMLETCSYCK